jgi:drug/metabolite transporter (DMT)-like permease
MLPRDFALLLVICLVWASNFIVAKLVLADLHIPPLFFSALRLGVVLVAVCPWLFPVPRPVWRMIAVGLLMGAGSFGLMTIGLMTATPSSVAAASTVSTAIPGGAVAHCDKSLLTFKQSESVPVASGLARRALKDDHGRSDVHPLQ